MRQQGPIETDLATLLLCGNDTELETIAGPLRGLLPEFALHPVIRHAGHRLSRCPVTVAQFILSLVDTLPARLYGDAEADLAAAAIVERGTPLPARASLAELDAILLAPSPGLAPSDLGLLALALARLRRPIAKRARWVGIALDDEIFSLKTETGMNSGGFGAGLGAGMEQLWRNASGAVLDTPLFEAFLSRMAEEQDKLGRVNILLAGKTGVGKSTLVNHVFGEAVAATGSGRPVTEHINWYEPAGLPVRLCDTKGLELAAFASILAGLEAEIVRSFASGRLSERIHLVWLCIAEPSERVEEGEIALATLCARHGLPVVVVLTKAIGPRGFAATVKTLIPEASAVVRVLAEPWGDDPPRPAHGLPDLIRATHDLLPDATRNAFDAAQTVVIEGKRARAIGLVRAAAGTAALAAATPIPIADAAAVLAANTGMIVAVSVTMGVAMSRGNLQTLAASMIGAMAATGGGRLIAGEILKLIPGIGSIAGGFITSGIAASATYGLGYAYVEFLCRFQASRHRMPEGDEIRSGFRQFWERWETKELAPPKVE